MALRLHNTLTKREEEFVPREAGKAAMYVCGPTVYDSSHVGHMRAAIVFDVLRRYLEFRGFRVRHVQNVTDVEDKIIARAQAEGVPPEQITNRYSEEYQRAAEALNILAPHVEPRATQHIPEMITMIRTLIERGHAYYAEGDVYFDVTTLPEYGKLSGRVLDELKAGARVEPGEFKRHPADFALWKRAKLGEPSWDSPWGKGRPGWHIECSAMSLKYLGMGFDIHGGGDDLIFPHHENEIAQSEAYAGTQPFARYWLHNAMVMTRGEKMSKSMHNYFAIERALQRYSGVVVRYALVSVHYRKPLDFEEERFDDAAHAVERIRVALASVEAALRLARRDGEENLESLIGSEVGLQKAVSRAHEQFLAAMDDDLNTSGALAAIFDLVLEANRTADGVLKGVEPARGAAAGLRQARDALQELMNVLGLVITPAISGQVITESPGVTISETPTATVTLVPGALRLKLTHRLQELAADLRRNVGHFLPDELPEDLEGLLQVILHGREQARKTKDFKTADAIRSRLTEAGILVEDLPTGPRWRIAGPDGHAPN